ncbi:MAG: hypothetical protein NTZ10_03890 [Candidatus Saganbacteria bacterium]|nr:hypothetical protein [Candidatus Saganbacteria bacterium]
MPIILRGRDRLLGQAVIIDALFPKGLAAGNMPVQISAIKISQMTLEKNGWFHTLARPSSRLPYNFFRLTGLNNDNLLFAPEIDDVTPHLESFLSNATLVGFGITPVVDFLSTFLPDIKTRSCIDLKNNMIRTGVSTGNISLEAFASAHGFRAGLDISRSSMSRASLIFQILCHLTGKKESLLEMNGSVMLSPMRENGTRSIPGSNYEFIDIRSPETEVLLTDLKWLMVKSLTSIFAKNGTDREDKDMPGLFSAIKTAYPSGGWKPDSAKLRLSLSKYFRKLRVGKETADGIVGRLAGMAEKGEPRFLICWEICKEALKRYFPSRKGVRDKSLYKEFAKIAFLNSLFWHLTFGETEECRSRLQEFYRSKWKDYARELQDTEELTKVRTSLASHERGLSDFRLQEMGKYCERYLLDEEQAIIIARTRERALRLNEILSGKGVRCGTVYSRDNHGEIKSFTPHQRDVAVRSLHDHNIKILICEEGSLPNLLGVPVRKMLFETVPLRPSIMRTIKESVCRDADIHFLVGSNDTERAMRERFEGYLDQLNTPPAPREARLPYKDQE